MKLLITHQEAEQSLADTLDVLWRSVCGRRLIIFHYLLPLDESERLLLFHREAQDLAHGVKHVRLGRLVTLRVRILDKEGIDHSTIYHELLAFGLFLDLLDELSRVPPHLISFRFQGVFLLQLCLVVPLELTDLGL